MRARLRPGDGEPIIAGIVLAIIGFSGAFAIVLAGLRAVGADEAQAASGLLVLCLTMGVASIALSWRTKLPIAIAWSTPGAALLVSAGAVEGGYPAALGAFVLTGLLLTAAGFWRRLARWLELIPASLANALLAGVLLPVCLTPARAVVDLPWLAGPVVVTWAILLLTARRWAVPGALIVAGIALAIDRPIEAAANSVGLLPSFVFTTPVFEPGTLIGLGIPLFIVTMASQNVTGMSVLASFGYRAPMGPVLVTTGALTTVAAPFGAHSINLAAITAALAAGPEAHPDPGRRWVAAVSSGFTYLLIGAGAGLATILLINSPPVLIEAVAGLALLPTLGNALAAAVAKPEHREAATITLVASASGIVALGITAPFWGLVAGIAFLAAARLRAPSGAEPPK